MFVMRPVETSDLGALIAFAESSVGGITSLPKRPELLEQRIEESLSGSKPLFVLEKGEEVIGCSGISPHSTYTLYRIEEELLVVDQLPPHTEVGSLFLRSDARGQGLGWLLTRPRYLYIRAFPDRFHENLVSSVRGVIDDDGSCPFWDLVSRPLYNDMEFEEATLLRFVDPQFVTRHAPSEPIHIEVLPPEAQELIAKPHPTTESGRAMVMAEGFEPLGCIDIFDGGPFLTAEREHVRAIRDRRGKPLEGLQIMANDREDFRACLASEVTQEVIDALQGEPQSFLGRHP